MRHRFLLLAIATACSILVGGSTDASLTGVTTRVSVDNDGNEGNNGSWDPAISGDGRYVAFASAASNLVAADSNGDADVFVHDRLTNENTRISVDSSGGQANGDSWGAAITPDGRYVAFVSSATNLVPGDTNNFCPDYQGHYDVNCDDVFVHDRITGQTQMVSVASGGVQANHDSTSGDISADGRYVVFMSGASNLPGGGIYVHDRVTGNTEPAGVNSAGVPANDQTNRPAISANGRFVAFSSGAWNLVTGDTNNAYDVFVHDRETGATTRESVDSAGNQGSAGSESGAISSDGRYVLFTSDASNLVVGDTNGYTDVFVRDRQTGATTRVSVDSTGNQANGDSISASISADGRFVAFYSYASDLVPNDSNNLSDLFLHDRNAAQTIRVSVNSVGEQGNGSSYDCYGECISDDDRYVAFGSYASNLVSGDTNGHEDVFVFERGEPAPVGGIAEAPDDLASTGDGSGGWRIAAAGIAAMILLSTGAIFAERRYSVRRR